MPKYNFIALHSLVFVFSFLPVTVSVPTYDIRALCHCYEQTSVTNLWVGEGAIGISFSSFSTMNMPKGVVRSFLCLQILLFNQFSLYSFVAQLIRTKCAFPIAMKAPRVTALAYLLYPKYCQYFPFPLFYFLFLIRNLKVNACVHLTRVPSI